MRLITTLLGLLGLSSCVDIARLGLLPGEPVFIQGRQYIVSVICGAAGLGVWIDLIQLRPGRS